MKFYNDFIGEDANNIKLNFLHGNGDSEENYLANLKTQPDDWYYREKKVEYAFNSYGHRSKEIKDLTMNSPYGVYLGRRFQPPGQKMFNSGGAGYILDKKAVRLLSENIDTPKCYPHQVGFWEDVNIAHCLLVSSEGKLFGYDTRDSLERERFHPFTPGQHITYGVPTMPKEDWYVKYNPQGLKTGVECCSEYSVSFHYVGAELMRQLHGYLYNCHEKGKS